MSITKPPILVIGGPTASGKTDCGKYIAQKYNGVVISADSRQVYKGLDIGTGKDTSFHQEMIDIINPPTSVYPDITLEVITGYTSGYSVSDFASRAHTVISSLTRNHTYPVLVGGTGYYIDAVLYNTSFPPIINQEIRVSLESKPTQQLLDDLTLLDPRSALRVGKNKRRIIRALEILYTSGKPVPLQRKVLRYTPLMIVCDPGPDAVRTRIADRLDLRLQSGMIAEVENLRKYVDNQWLRNLGLEYQYISDYCDGVYSYDQMRALLYNAICAFARRQRTWFRRYPDAHWVKQPDDAYPLVDNFIKRYTVI